jgi:tetratricopeptide (TPR) repeat protein
MRGTDPTTMRAATMPEVLHRVEELRQIALAKHRGGALEEALLAYDEALTAGADDEQRELITINKADVLIEMQRSGPEVQALPMILMRRRNPHHTFLAAYQLQFKHRTAGEKDRAAFYGQIARAAAVETGNKFWQIASLNELGILFEADSQFDKAIECFEESLAHLDSLDAPSEHRIGRTATVQNLAYNKLLVGQTDDALRLLHEVLDDIENPSSRADALVDLCYGYVELEQYEKAIEYGRASLEIAVEPRQIRNAHYLLGEASYKSGDIGTAEFHFEELARFYPQFRNLKSLLFAIDLRSMLNLNL